MKIVTLITKSYTLFNEHSEYVCMDEKFKLFWLFLLLCVFLYLLWDLTHFSLANTILKIRNKTVSFIFF